MLEIRRDVYMEKQTVTRAEARFALVQDGLWALVREYGDVT
jgi:hypothetical protein